MTNELLWLAMLVANFAIILVLYRTLGKLGLYVWIPIAVIVANIQVLKYVELLGFTATLGNIVYASSFLVTDILSENHGRKAANRAVLIGFIALVATVGLMNLALVFRPGAADSAQIHLVAIFSLLPRITAASLAAYLVSQFHDVWAYHFWKRLVPGRRSIWLRNNASTVVSQILDSAVFTILAFVGTVSGRVLLEILVTTFVVKAAVAILDTPLVYLAARWKNRADEIDEQFA